MLLSGSLEAQRPVRCLKFKFTNVLNIVNLYKLPAACRILSNLRKSQIGKHHARIDGPDDDQTVFDLLSKCVSEVFNSFQYFK